MANQMLPGYVKGDSTNLPKIDMFMIIEFIATDDRFNAAEVRGAKATLSSRESYGDSAIGYVCLRRENSRCIVKGKITPEHRVRQKQYSVTLTINEDGEKIENIECHDCPASTGGCKHAIAFLMWNHRRTKTPSPTEVECYWKKSILSNVGTSKKFITTSELMKRTLSTSEQLPDNSTFLENVIQKAQEKQLDSQLSRHNFELSDNKVRSLSIHQLLLKFCDKGGHSADDFIEFARKEMLHDLCKVAEFNTREQSDSLLWFELRYGRVTASKAHEAANCHVPDGSLVKQIIGAAKAFDSIEMERGRKLEEKVRCEVEKSIGQRIRKSGFLLMPTLPIMGASPDGITDDSIIEIKCPATEKGFQRFVPNGQVNIKCKVQMNLQMLAAEKKKGLFCVADPNFERNRIVSMVWLNYDDQLTCQIVESAVEFWKQNIFPVMIHSVKK